MNEYTKIICPDCGAVNGPGAPACHTCGTGLVRGGFAARRDDDEDDEPRRPAKKPARPDDAVKKGSPPPKKRPVDDDEDDEPRRPAKKRRDDDDEDDDEPRRPSKKSRRDEDEDEEPESLRDNTILNMFFPVGVNLWAMGSFLMGLFGLIAAGAGWVLANYFLNKWIGIGLGVVAAVMCLLALPLGGLSFILRPKKTTYGGVTSYMRAVIGILCGLIGILGAAYVIWWAATFAFQAPGAAPPGG